MPEDRTPHAILNIDFIGLDQLPEELPLPFPTTHERFDPLLSVQRESDELFNEETFPDLHRC